jgi:Zn-dependent metalloprotease
MILVLAVCGASRADAQSQPTALAVTRAESADLRAADQQLDQMIRGRDLQIREVGRDAFLPGRQHQRLDQYVRGVRIFGGDLTRQLAADGTVSIFGILHGTIGIDTEPALSTDGARGAIVAAVSGQYSGAEPELIVLPMSDGYHLAYLGQVFTGLEVFTVFVDAKTGALLRQYSAFVSEGAAGKGVGTYGDSKKISVSPTSGTFVADDLLRPARITTYDMRGNVARTAQVLANSASVTASDIASDSDNDWTDTTVVDAHVYAGWYYDYLFKRFARNGVDDRNLRIAIFTHPVRLADISTAPPNVVGTYYVNAFFCSTCGPDRRGAVTFGEGAPRGFFGPFEVKPFAAAFDVVAHELTHAVTAATARLNGFPFSEAGALNEGFSDIFGTAAAFFTEPTGSGPLNASYIQGRALTVPAGVIGRSLANPRDNGDPDHYTQRIVGFDPHYNSTIASHAFYLAVEGGTNRTSGQTVQGVGAANREQIEKAFFRALTVLLPSNATFALARAATIQAARDLYGAGGPVERAITQAWDAVGVQPRTVPTATLLPNPAQSVVNACTLSNPQWILGVTVSAGSSNLRITQWTFDAFDHTGALRQHSVSSGAQFGQLFNACGPGSDRVLAQTDACSSLCLSLGGDQSGSAQITFTATDDAARPVTVSTARVTLQPPQ